MYQQRLVYKESSIGYLNNSQSDFVQIGLLRLNLDTFTFKVVARSLKNKSFHCLSNCFIYLRVKVSNIDSSSAAHALNEQKGV